jgi:L-2,4-diaminobutyric acid acetyltransferase
VTPSEPLHTDIRFERPSVTDGPALWHLVGACPPLDRNSPYCYLLLATHFAATCVVARAGTAIAGAITGYRLPEAADTLFVWQVAVHPDFRGRALGARMLDALRAAPGCAGVRYVHTTVTPDNRPSNAMFEAFARRHGAALARGPGFGAALFPPTPCAAPHAPEECLRIGPFAPPS